MLEILAPMGGKSMDRKSLGAGPKYPLGPQASLRGGYKFFATADPTFGTTEGEYLSHNFELGLTYAF